VGYSIPGWGKKKNPYGSNHRLTSGSACPLTAVIESNQERPGVRGGKPRVARETKTSGQCGVVKLKLGTMRGSRKESGEKKSSSLGELGTRKDHGVDQKKRGGVQGAGSNLWGEKYQMLCKCWEFVGFKVKGLSGARGLEGDSSPEGMKKGLTAGDSESARWHKFSLSGTTAQTE